MELELIKEKIDKITDCQKIEIIGVTKTRSAMEVDLLIQNGINSIGENRVQEAREKFPLLSHKVTKHLIGPLQSNKENQALELFNVIQSIESLAQLERLTQKIQQKNLSMSIFLQYNTSLEDTKHGIREEETLYKIVEFLLSHPTISFQGLMTIGALREEEKIIRKSFERLRILKESILTRYPEIPFLKLSMGMSNDFELALKEGSDMLRLGSILFK